MFRESEPNKHLLPDTDTAQGSVVEESQTQNKPFKIVPVEVKIGQQPNQQPKAKKRLISGPPTITIIKLETPKDGQETPEHADLKNMGGDEFEEYLIPKVITPGWDKQKFITKPKSKKQEDIDENHRMKDRMIRDWVWEYCFQKQKPKGLPNVGVKEMGKLIFEWTKRNQPENWEPARPIRLKTETRKNQDGKSETKEERHYEMLELFNEIKTQMKEQLGEKYDDSKLLLYTTADTPFDHGFGTDAVFEYGDVYEPVDMTQNEDKRSNSIRYGKPDIFISWDTFDKKNQDSSMQKHNLKRIATAIVRSLIKKIHIRL